MAGSVTPGAPGWTTNGWACKLLKTSGCRGPEYKAMGQTWTVQSRQLLNQMMEVGYELRIHGRSGPGSAHVIDRSPWLEAVKARLDEE
ncbi:hypothetical protein N7474_001876 [Penicillium riverlandense]|uniref:uncharacterized protein n=1 Tax=Penicillium riverlandense TaxID=1903569 RepID=UPI0025498140|nr:uncharacterized protein N7474_001876 [Penicillium riverlandense]KAJ5833565.1 hypothetical protein N7474_001876 [Penicillium riverlandense]